MNLSFQFLDLAVVAIVIASAIYATYRGLVSESLAIFGWIAAAYATLYFGPWVAWWMQDMIKPQVLGQAVGYLIVFLIILVPLQFASSRISQNVKKTQVGTLDSALGTAFGILRGVAIVGIAYLVFTAWVPYHDQPRWITTTQTFPVIRASAEVVASLIPDQNVRVPREQRKDPNDSPDPISEQLRQSQEPAPAPAKSQSEPADSAPEAAPPPPAAHKSPKHAKKTYGAKDRHALDSLIETTSSDKSGKR